MHKPVFVLVRGVARLAESPHCAHILLHVGYSVFVFVPLVFPVIRQQVLAVVHHRRLNIDAHAHKIIGTFIIIGVCLFRKFGKLVIRVELIYRQRRYMLAVAVFHKNVVSLIQHVGTVTVRTVLGKVGILILIGVNRDDIVFLVLLVKAVEQKFEIARLLRRVVFEHMQGYRTRRRAALQIALKLFV